MLLSTQTSGVVSRFGYEEGVKLLHNAGYDCLDLSLFEMVDDKSVYVQENWRETVEARKKFADENGIVFDQSHAPFSFRWDKPEIFEIGKKRVEQSIEISAMMGVKNVVVHPLHWFPYKGFEKEAFDMNVNYYKELIPICRDLGVRVALENMWQKEVKRKCISFDVASTVAEHIALLDTIDSEYIVGCLDLGHVALIGEEPEDSIRALGHDRLKALHVHDNSYTNDDHLLPGQGKLNWDAIMASLKAIDYDGVFTYEADGFLRNWKNDYIAEAVKFMEQTGRYLLAKLDK